MAREFLAIILSHIVANFFVHYLKFYYRLFMRFSIIRYNIYNQRKEGDTMSNLKFI